MVEPIADLQDRIRAQLVDGCGAQRFVDHRCLFHAVFRAAILMGSQPEGEHLGRRAGAPVYFGTLISASAFYRRGHTR